jgi:hypothetical protein
MLKHRGFPSRLPGSEFQFTIRRPNKKGATLLKPRERFADRRFADRRADEHFMWCLWSQFGERPFERGNLDAGRLSWLFGREVIEAEKPFNYSSYNAMLKINVQKAMASFPEIFAEDYEGLA